MHEHDGNRVGGFKKGPDGSRAWAQEQVRCERNQFARILAHGCETACTPALIDPQVAPDSPAQLLQFLQKGAKSGLSFGIVRGQRHEHADAPHAVGLLRARRQRPRRCRAAEKRDELPPPDHSITSSARASMLGGTSRPSALAVLRLMTSSYLVGACTGRSAGFAPLRIRST